jgi:hypothetical protein
VDEPKAECGTGSEGEDKEPPFFGRRGHWEY